MNSNLPPMSGRIFRDYFMIEDRYEGEGANLKRPAAPRKPALCGSGANRHERTPECIGAADCTLGKRDGGE